MYHLNLEGARNSVPWSVFSQNSKSHPHYDQMNRELLSKIEELDHHLSCQIQVVACLKCQHHLHSEDLGHSKGLSIDIICPEYNLFQLYLETERFGFEQIGLYRDWYLNRPSNVIGGLHLSIQKPKNKIKSRWISIKRGHREEVAVLGHESLKKMYII